MIGDESPLACISIDRRDEICLFVPKDTKHRSSLSIPSREPNPLRVASARGVVTDRHDPISLMRCPRTRSQITKRLPMIPPLIREEVAKCDPSVCRAFNLQLIRFACRSRAVPSSSCSSARHIGIYRPLPPDRPKRIARLHRETIIIVSRVSVRRWPPVCLFRTFPRAGLVRRAEGPRFPPTWTSRGPRFVRGAIYAVPR